jgi:eukaryotic-like serine/threonine-protein kinase
MDRRADDSSLALHYHPHASVTEYVSIESPVASISDRFRVLRELGRGGMGVVYLAYDVHRDMEVAIKLCTYPQLSPLHIKREFRVAASLRHPNLVEFYDLIYHKQQAYFTMEYVEGCSLRRYVSAHDEYREGITGIARRPTTASAPSTRTLPPAPASSRRLDAFALDGGKGAEEPSAPEPPQVDFDRVRNVLGQLAAGLARLHAGGVVHRDVKPSNALVTRDGVVKLLDFGLARDAEHLEPIDGDGHLVGTAAYLAPEYIQRMRVSPALDLYALGVVGYELCTGSPPFGGTLYSIARMRRPVVIPTARVRNPSVPEDLDALLETLLNDDPERRPSAAEVAARLRGAPAITAPIALPQLVVGRTAELESLSSLLDAATAPQLVLITGAAGIGKSTLMSRALQSLRTDQTLVWRGYCHERERVPYRAFDAIIDDLADALTAGEHLLDDLPFCGALTRVFAALKEPLSGMVLDPTPPAADLRVERERALSAMAELIARQADGSASGLRSGYRTVIAIENLQWVDAESVELMHMLLQLDRPVTILATCTTEAGGDGLLEELPAKIAELAHDHPSTARIDLSPLGDRDILPLVGAVAPNLTDDEHLEIAAAAAGNPYLAEVLARDAERRGRAGGHPVPAQLLQLARVERQVISAVATVATSATFDQLRFVTALPSRQVQSALRALESERVLRAVPSQSGEPTYDFYHKVLRGAAYALLTAAERRTLHERFAVWFENAAGARPAFQALAEHWHLAGKSANAARWALAAADASLGQLAFGAAADWYNRAVIMSAQAPEQGTALAMVTRRARIGYAEATYLDGDIAAAAVLFRELVALDTSNSEHWRRRLADAERELAARELPELHEAATGSSA